jgi:predicted amidohydrolase YtcJ
MDTLAAYTRNGAWAAHAEDRTGCLRAGMLADLVLLSGDIGATPPEEIDKLSVALTVCGGQVTHRGT